MMPRVYSETLPLDAIARSIALLRHYALEVVVAVRPWDKEALCSLAGKLRDGGVSFSIWPMLADEDGRWANVHNAREFASFALSLCDALHDAPPRDVLFDVEPPPSHVRPLVKMAGGAPGGVQAPGKHHPKWRRLVARSASFAEASSILAGAIADIRSRGIATSMAVWPLVALDRPGAHRWQSVLGTPVDGLDADHVSVMMYTSILEGWSRGVLRRDDTTSLLARATERALLRWGPRAGVSLGCVGTGAFEDEPTYRSPRDLAEDVAIARSAGCDRLSLFDLGGVLARPPAEAWLEAFVSGQGSAVSGQPSAGPSARVRVVRTLARAATELLRLTDR